MDHGARLPPRPLGSPQGHLKRTRCAINSASGFEALPQFGKAEMEARQRLYRLLADRVWDPAQLTREAQGAETAER